MLKSPMGPSGNRKGILHHSEHSATEMRAGRGARRADSRGGGSDLDAALDLVDRHRVRGPVVELRRLRRHVTARSAAPAREFPRSTRCTRAPPLPGPPAARGSGPSATDPLGSWSLGQRSAGPGTGPGRPCRSSRGASSPSAGERTGGGAARWRRSQGTSLSARPAAPSGGGGSQTRPAAPIGEPFEHDSRTADAARAHGPAGATPSIGPPPRPRSRREHPPGLLRGAPPPLALSAVLPGPPRRRATRAWGRTARVLAGYRRTVRRILEPPARVSHRASVRFPFSVSPGVGFECRLTLRVGADARAPVNLTPIGRSQVPFEGPNLLPQPAAAPRLPSSSTNPGVRAASPGIGRSVPPDVRDRRAPHPSVGPDGRPLQDAALAAYLAEMHDQGRVPASVSPPVGRGVLRIPPRRRAEPRPGNGRTGSDGRGSTSRDGHGMLPSGQSDRTEHPATMRNSTAS